MKRATVCLLAWVLSMILVWTALPMDIFAGAESADTSAEDVQTPEAEPDDPANSPTPPEDSGTASAPSQSPVQTPEVTPSPEPSGIAPSPTFTPEETGTPSSAAEASSPFPSVAPTLAPTPSPEAAIPVTYSVSPDAAVYPLGSQAGLSFSISPLDAPFSGVEGLDWTCQDGVVTLRSDALATLCAGEHVLAFLFSDGMRVEVPLTVTEPRLLAKGSAKWLKIGGKDYAADGLASDTSSISQHWFWNAAEETLTLSGYNGSEIQYDGGKPLEILLTPGTENTIVSSASEGSLNSKPGLILSGGGTLRVSNTAESAIMCRGVIAIEGGTITVSGKKQALYSTQEIIQVRGGTVTVNQEGHQGAGFAGKVATRVDGGTVMVQGADIAFSSLDLRGGSVTITDCETGANALSATGGTLTISGTTQCAVESKAAIGLSNYALTIRDCGRYGLYTESGLDIGNGANVNIEAKIIALYAPAGAYSLVIEKGANLDLRGGERAIQAEKATIGGKRYTGAYNHLVIRNGAVVQQGNDIFSLLIGGATYAASSITSDQSGEGWRWSAKGKTLALDGYDGAAVTAAGSGITLSLNGENRVQGDLSVSGATIQGGGTLAVSRVISKAGLDIRAGSINAARLVTDGDVAVSGGAVSLTGDEEGPAIECVAFTMAGGSLTLLAGSGVALEGVHSSGKALVSGGMVSVKGFQEFLLAGDVNVVGGSISVGDGAGCGIVSGKNIAMSGGTVEIKTTGCALDAGAGSVTITGKPDLRLESVENTAFAAKTVRISGKTYAKRYAGVVIKNGKLIEEFKQEPDLVIAGHSYFMKEMNLSDLSGDGWSWNARKKTLTLNGYHGKGIWLNRTATVALTAGTSNSGSDDYHSGDAAIYSTERLTLTGTGRWSGGLYADGDMSVTGTPIIRASGIQSGKDLSVTGGHLQASGGILAEKGKLSIQNASVTASRLYGGRLEISKGTIITTARDGEDDPDLKGDSALTVSSSVVFCTNLGSPNGKVSLSGSPVFLRGEVSGSEIWSLRQSVAITRDMTLPLGRRCLVPASQTLSVAKGKKLYVYGTLSIEGRVSGAVISRTEAGDIAISGSASVARGKRVQLAAKVVPLVSGGTADQSVSWSSDKPWLVSVSDKGLVGTTNLAETGDTAVVTCAAMDGSGVSAEWIMTVTEPAQKISIWNSGVSISRLTVGRAVGSVKLDYDVAPAAAAKTVQWTSSNSAVAAVDQEGLVRLGKKGTAVLTCAALDGSGAKASVKLSVK